MNCLQLFFLSCLLYVGKLNAQVEVATDIFHDGNYYDVFIVKTDINSLSNFDIIENKSRERHYDLMKSIDSDLNFFALNASISDSLCMPIGLYIKDYNEHKPANYLDGTGNFYLKPNGALLITETEAVICESSQIINHSKVRLGIQSGPILVSNGVINPQFNPNSINKHVRCGVGQFTGLNDVNYLVFAISKQSVSFYQFAKFLLRSINALMHYVWKVKVAQ